MSEKKAFDPGSASGAEVLKDGNQWTLVLVRELGHAPSKVWESLVDPAHLQAWAPFEADRRLDQVGATVALTTVGAPTAQISQTTIRRSDAPRVLEFDWGGRLVRWELKPTPRGTRLTLWASIDPGFISMGAAGWHLCLAVLDRFLEGTPVGRTVGMEALQFEGWQRLNQDYARLFGVEPPQWKGGSK